MAGQKMLKFTTVARDMPEKRPPNLRREDCNEIYAEYARDKAAEQADDLHDGVFRHLVLGDVTEYLSKLIGQKNEQQHRGHRKPCLGDFPEQIAIENSEHIDE